MSAGSDFTSSRCTLHSQPVSFSDRRIEIVLQFELLDDQETEWGVEFRNGKSLQFQAKGFLHAAQIKEFIRQLRQSIDRQPGEVVLKDCDHAVDLAVRVENGGGLVSLQFRFESRHDGDGRTSQSVTTINDLPLEDGEVQRIYAWARDWSNLL